MDDMSYPSYNPKEGAVFVHGYKEYILMYDYLIVGSGFFGSICARELTDSGKKVCVIENRNHIGGNCYTSKRDGINVHDYGPHISYFK